MRVVAAVAGTTVPSNEIVVVVGPTSVPTAPLALGATVTDHTVVMTWTAPANAAVAPVATYVIEAGTTPGATDSANFATGSAATSFLTPPVPNGSYPNGSYYVRVRARNASGTGPPTPDLRVVVGPSPPGPPVLTGSVGSDRTVFLAWTWPVTGAAVTGYQLEAGTAPGLSNAAVRLLPSTARPLVPPAYRRYLLRPNRGHECARTGLRLQGSHHRRAVGRVASNSWVATVRAHGIRQSSCPDTGAADDGDGF